MSIKFYINQKSFDLSIRYIENNLFFKIDPLVSHFGHKMCLLFVNLVRRFYLFIYLFMGHINLCL